MVEGRIAGPWVRELRRAADLCLEKHPTAALDLSGVSFVDAEGASLLRSLLARRMPVLASSAFVTAMLGEPQS
jgi:anti-anti-sigma regulatory factor